MTPIYSRVSNYTVDVVTWRKFGNSGSFMGEAIITSTLKRFDQKNLFFLRRALGSSSIRYGLVLGMALKFYTSVKKRIKLKVRTFWKLISCLIAIYSMQGWKATTMHRVPRKRSTKRLKHTGNLFTKNLQLISAC